MQGGDQGLRLLGAILERGIFVGELRQDAVLSLGFGAFHRCKRLIVLLVNRTGERLCERRIVGRAGHDNAEFLERRERGVKLGGGLEIDMKNGFFLFSEVDDILYNNWTPGHSLGSTVISNDEIRALAGIGKRF